MGTFRLNESTVLESWLSSNQSNVQKALSSFRLSIRFSNWAFIMRLRVQNINLDIISVGGLYTVVQLPNYKVAIDLGICPRSSFNKAHVFFTHTHADHISGVIRHCASRRLLGLTPPTYVIGAEDAENFQSFMAIAGKLVRSDMEYNIEVVSPGDRIDINKQ